MVHRGQGGQPLADGGGIDAEGQGHGDGARHVGGLRAGGHRHVLGHRPAVDVGGHGAAVGRADHADVGPPVHRRAPPDPLPLGRGSDGHGGQAGVVHREDHLPCRDQDLGLGLDDAFLGAESLEMDRPDGRDHGDVRRAPAAQLGDLPGPVGAHLGDEHLGTVSQVLVDRPGQAGAVVEAGRGGHHRPGGAHQLGDVALGRGLSVGAGDAHHRRVDPGQARAGLLDEVVRQSALDRGGDQAGHVHQEGHGHRGQGGDRGGRSRAPRRRPPAPARSPPTPGPGS